MPILVKPVRRAAAQLSLHALLFASGFLPASVERPAETVPRAGSWSGVAIVLELPVAKPRSYQTEVRLLGEHRLKSMVYLQKDERASRLLPGDRIYLDLRWSPITSPELPGDFNYAAYLARRKCYYTGYARSDSWLSLPGPAPGMAVRRMASVFKKRSANILTEELRPPAGGLAAAMLLGDKTMLETATRTSFAQAGIMHILAVSGLHVSIIYLLVASAHRPFTRHSRKWLPAAIALEVAAIWSFACITGLGPSVQRAAIMFSLFAISKVLRQDADVRNITAASAILVLLSDPAMLFAPGFLLSYSAVYGILLLYPKLSPLLTFRSPIARWIWQLEVVSLSAVAGTTPLALFYFGQFPLLFPLSNLIAIPAAFALVSGAVILLLIYPITWLAGILTGLLYLVATVLVKGTDWISGLPLSHIARISCTPGQAVLVLLAIATTVLFLYAPQRYRRSIFICFLACLSGIFLQHGALATRQYGHREIHTSRKGDQWWISCGKQLYEISVSGTEDTYRTTPDGFLRHARIRRSERFPISEQNKKVVEQWLTGAGHRGSPGSHHTPASVRPPQ